MFEIADVTMGDLSAMSATTWYATLGYRTGNFLPFISFQDLEQGEPVVDDDQKITTLGVRWDLQKDVAVKLELSNIKLDSGVGLFSDLPNDDSIKMIGIAIDTVF